MAVTKLHEKIGEARTERDAALERCISLEDQIDNLRLDLAEAETRADELEDALADELGAS